MKGLARLWKERLEVSAFVLHRSSLLVFVFFLPFFSWFFFVPFIFSYPSLRDSAGNVLVCSGCADAAAYSWLICRPHVPVFRTFLVSSLLSDFILVSVLLVCTVCASTNIRAETRLRAVVPRVGTSVG